PCIGLLPDPFPASRAFLPLILPVFLPIPGRLLPVLLHSLTMLLPVFAVSSVARLLPGLEVSGRILAATLAGRITRLLSGLHLLGCCLPAGLTGGATALPAATASNPTARITSGGAPTRTARRPSPAE